MEQNTQKMIHTIASTPKQTTVISSGVDDNFNLYIHSMSSMSATIEKFFPRSNTAAIVTSQTYNEALLRKMPRKPEYEGSESTYTDHSHDEKTTEDTES